MIPTPHECRVCKRTYPKFQPRCDSCRMFNTVRKQVESLIVSSTTEMVEYTSEMWETGDPIWDGAFGGLPKNYAVLVAGMAGVGKSTIVMQAAGGLARNGKRGLYVCGEEHIAQTIARAKTVGAIHKNLDMIPGASDWDDILRAARKYDFAIYDSIQKLGVQSSACVEPSTRILISQLNGEGAIAQGRDNEHDPDVLAFCHQQGDDVVLGPGQKARLGSLDISKYRLHGLQSVSYLLRERAIPRVKGDIERLRDEYGYDLLVTDEENEDE